MPTDPAARAGALLDIDLGAIVANWRQLVAYVAPAICAAVVKGDAYGLGAAEVAPALAVAGCRMFFIATIDEGISLRAILGPTPEIVVLNGPLPGTQSEFLKEGLIPVLNDPGQIALWAGVSSPPTSKGGPAPAILHIDTGMARLGLTASEFARLIVEPPPLRWRAVMSHLACADEPNHPLNAAQWASFAAALRSFPGIPASLAASSGIFLGIGCHFDLVRPGAALFGVNPRPGTRNRMRPVVRLRAKILQVREIDSGTPVGYGAAQVMQRAGRLATVAVGYADGWLRSLSHQGCGFLAGKRVPMVGRVSMDLAIFDVSDVKPALAHPGALIELLGVDHGVDEVGQAAATNGYEILTSLGRRYHRTYHGPVA